MNHFSPAADDLLTVAGRTFHSRIGATWVNGELAWDGSQLAGTPNGQRLEFAR